MGFFVDSLLLEDASNLRLEDGERLALDLSDAPTGAIAARLATETASGDVQSRVILEDGSGAAILIEGVTAEASELGNFDNGAVFPSVVAIPSILGRGTSGGPGWRTVVQTTSDGGDILVQKWSRPQRRWTVRTGLHESSETRGDLPSYVERLLNFYRAQRGSLIGFRFEDPFDNSTHHQHVGFPDLLDYRHRHVIGAGDGTTTDYQLIKRYKHGNIVRNRPITRPLIVLVWVGGVLKGVGTDLIVNYDGGGIVFDSAPTKGEVIEWAGTFHVPARFSSSADQSFPQDLSFTELSAYQSFGITEIKENAPFSDHKQTGGFGDVAIPAGATSHAISLNDGHVQRITPSAVGTTILRTPMTTQVIDGGPVVTIVNGAAAASGKLLTIRTPDQAAEQVVVTSLAEGAYATLYYHEDGTWLGVK